MYFQGRSNVDFEMIYSSTWERSFKAKSGQRRMEGNVLLMDGGESVLHLGGRINLNMFLSRLQPDTSSRLYNVT